MWRAQKNSCLPLNDRSCCQRWLPGGESHFQRAARCSSSRQLLKTSDFEKTWTSYPWCLIPLAAVTGLGAKSLARFNCDLVEAGACHQQMKQHLVHRTVFILSNHCEWSASFNRQAGVLSVLQVSVLRHRECALSAGLSKKGDVEISYPWHVHYKIMASGVYWETWWNTLHRVPKVWSLVKFIILFEP